MSRLLLNNATTTTTALQRAANVAAATTTSTIRAQTQSSNALEQQKQQQQEKSKITPNAVIRRWKSFIHNNSNNQKLRTALSSSSSCTPSVLLPSSSASAPRRNNSQAVGLYTRGSSRHSPFNARYVSTTATAATSVKSSGVLLNDKSTNNIQNLITYSTSANMPSKCLQLDNINPNYIAMEYAVRGPLVIRAGEIEKELEEGVKKPFDNVIRANIGDCHAMGQQPLTFMRQLLVLTFEPRLLDSPDYPNDVKARARAILGNCQGHSVGSYTDSAGLEVVRRQVSAFIEKRDNVASDWHNIYLTAGATPGIKSILALLHCQVNGKTPGVMVPIPQYPLYSATVAEYGMVKVDYYLEEETGWSLNRAELQRSLDECKVRCNPRALVVINPGNPTGQVLTRDNIVEVIKFAHENKLLILADEVYQDNVYDKNSKFHSFKKVMYEMGEPYRSQELCSFLSTSKGYLGECGIRGGYMEVVNMCPKVQAMLSKSITAALCSTTAGQVAVSALVNPPQPGEPSYEQYIAEKNATLAALKERAELVYKTMSGFEGFKVNPVQGAMYVFPQIEIPPKAIEAAKAKNLAPDAFYAFELLETAGICIVPGSGFGQKPGTYHFRSTILPQTEKLKLMLEKFRTFHASFMQKYK